MDPATGPAVARLDHPAPGLATPTTPTPAASARSATRRLVPKDDESAAQLKKRTLTNLYNERPTWLALAHQKLDAAVALAYGWPADLAEEEILARLLKLNLERADRTNERGGTALP